MTTEVNQDKIIHDSIDFTKVVSEQEELYIRYNPINRDIHVQYQDRYIHAREVSITITEHSGALVRIRTQDPEFEQGNGLSLISAQDIYITDPSMFISSLVINNKQEVENGDNES